MSDANPQPPGILRRLVIVLARLPIAAGVLWSRSFTCAFFAVIPRFV